MAANFLVQRGFTAQAIEDKIADRVWSALAENDAMDAVFEGQIRRQHVHLSGVAGRPPLCCLVGVIRPEEAGRPSRLIAGHAHVGIMLEFEEFASDELAPGEPSVASLCSAIRALVDERLLHPITGEERVCSNAPEWTIPGAVPNEIRGSLTSFFVALEVRVPYKVTNPERANALAS